MGIRIFQSTTVVPLVHKLADELKDNTNIFTPDIIVTPNNGINNWLKISLQRETIFQLISYLQNTMN